MKSGMKSESARSLLLAFLSKPLFSFVMALLGMSAAYFTTIGNIKVALAEKAEIVLVEAIDKRLERLEVLIAEGTIRKDEFYQFKTDITSRLTRIEFYLSEQRRER